MLLFVFLVSSDGFSLSPGGRARFVDTPGLIDGVLAEIGGSLVAFGGSQVSSGGALATCDRVPVRLDTALVGFGIAFAAQGDWPAQLDTALADFESSAVRLWLQHPLFFPFASKTLPR